MLIEEIPMSLIRQVMSFMLFGHFGEERYARIDARLFAKYPEYQTISDLLLHS